MGNTERFTDTFKNFAIVEMDCGGKAKLAEHFIEYQEVFHFIDQRIAANNISITLKEFAVTAFLRTICPPYRLDLIASERESDVVLMLCYIAGKRHGKIVTQPFFGYGK